MAKKAVKPAEPPQFRGRAGAGTLDAAKKRDSYAEGRAISKHRKRKDRSEPLRPKHSSTPSRSSSHSRLPPKRPTRSVTSPADTEKSRQAYIAIVKPRPSAPPRRTSEHALSPRLGLLRPRSPASSIFSCQTTQTATSTSSNRTVTQESHNRSSRPAAAVDVFNFLEREEPPTIYEDEEGWDSDGSSSSEGSCTGSCWTSPPELDHDTHSVRSSSLWDSGMSANGDSPDPVRKQPRAIVAESTSGPPRHRRGSVFGEDKDTPEKIEDVKTPVPGAFPSFYPPPAAPSPPPAYQQQPRSVRQVTPGHFLQGPLQGYELLAQKLASADDDTPQPIYRRFGHLQHRSILHLQDVISEMEAELKMLDETLAQLTTDANGIHHSQSRRLDRVHHIGARRHQVLDCLTHHLTQYNQLLASQKASTLISPSPSQVDEYKTWLYSHQPIPANEATFLNHESDLMLFGPCYSTFDCSNRSAYFTGVWSALILCLVDMFLFFLPRT